MAWRPVWRGRGNGIDEVDMVFKHRRPRLTMRDLAELEEEFHMPIQKISEELQKGLPTNEEAKTEALRFRMYRKASWLMYRNTLD